MLEGKEREKEESEGMRVDEQSNPTPFFKQREFEQQGKKSPAMGPIARKDPFERSMEKLYTVLKCTNFH